MKQRRDSQERRAANLLGALSLAVGDAVLQAASEAADSPSAAAAIVRIGMHPGRSIEFLSHALSLSHSATVRLVDRLQSEGLVRRQRNPHGGKMDRRAVALQLTQEGTGRLESILTGRYERLLPLLDAISESERAQLVLIMEKLTEELANRRHLPHICRLCDYEACESEGCPVRPYLDQHSGDKSS